MKKKTISEGFHRPILDDMAADEKYIPLPIACQRLRRQYHELWKLMLAGGVEGKRIRGRWFVSERSVRHLEEQANGNRK